jgi:hypothetical protein
MVTRSLRPFPSRNTLRALQCIRITRVAVVVEVTRGHPIGGALDPGRSAVERVRAHHGRADVAVAEEQVGGERVPERAAGRRLGDADPVDGVLDGPPELCRHLTKSRIDLALGLWRTT